MYTQDLGIWNKSQMSTPLSYVIQSLIALLDWKELRNLLMNRFQPKEVTSAYKWKFRERWRKSNEDIHIYVEGAFGRVGLAVLIGPAGPKEMIADHFLNGMDNHELGVQAATSGSRTIEDAHLRKSARTTLTDRKLRSPPYKPLLLLGTVRLWQILTNPESVSLSERGKLKERQSQVTDTDTMT